MGTFRSAPGGNYYESVDEYREQVLSGQKLFGLVDKLGGGSTVPWLTFVLGSGCLAPTLESTGDRAWQIDDAVRGALEATGLGGDSFVVEEVAGFIRAMVRKKLPDTVGSGWLTDRSRSPEDGDPPCSPWRLAIAASCVATYATQVYAQLMEAGPRVVDRADREEITYPSPKSRWPSSHGLLVSSMTTTLRMLHEPDIKEPDPLSVDAFRRLLEAVHTEITHPTRAKLWRSQVEALTAFAWYFLTDGTSVYPGWSDMLLFQAASSSNNASEFARVPFLRRPRAKNLSPLDDGTALLNRLVRVTKRSWTGAEGTRDEFYERVAKVLVQQAAIRRDVFRRSSPRPVPQPPLAVAFNAAFDIELELALWAECVRAGAPFSRFAVVTPIYKVESDGGALNADLQWVWCVVTPTDDSPVSELIEPDPGSTGGAARSAWYPIDQDRPALPSELQELPIVVHLAGTPLFRLDRLEIHPSDPRPAFDGTVQVHHALLLDENIATIQFAEDVMDLPGQLHKKFIRSWDPSHAQDDDQLVPAPRFWSFIGTQLADPAIRFRLVANELRELSGSDQKGQIEGTAARFELSAEHRGLVIMDWVPAAEREVFLWHGYDVVRGKVRDMLEDIGDFSDRVTARVERVVGGGVHV